MSIATPTTSASRVARVLILRPEHIGDAVICSWALARIRTHWPKARIDLMVQPAVRELLAAVGGTYS